MRRAVHTLFGVLSLVVCAACAAPWADAGTPSPGQAEARCGSGVGHTIATSAEARVYSLRGRVYGCSDRAGKVYLLGNSAICISSRRVGPVAVAGGLAAYGSESCGIDTGSSQIVVRRLSDDKQVFNDRANSLPLGPESYESVTSIALRANGDVGWIAVGTSLVSHAKDVEVHKQDKGGEYLLDSGAPVRPWSLKLRGTRLTWIHGHTLRSTALR